jgi:electron transport complex protein RnfC
VIKQRSFSGGVHPSAFKEPTAGKAIVRVPLPQRVFIPLQQHTGAPAKALVKKGDTVKTGQVIGEASGFISLPVHASISGKVVDVGLFPHPLFRQAEMVAIESDDSDVWEEGIGKSVDIDNLSPAQMREAISRAGVAGMGGAAFPTHVKLSPPEGKQIDTVILNGAECEPYLTCDHRLMLEFPEKIVDGLKIILEILGCQRACIAVEVNKPDAIARLKQSVDGNELISIVPLKVKYPQGAEKQLIHAITKREVPSGGLPMDVGCVVQNVATAFAISEAVSLNKPLIERVVAVTGPGVEEPQNIWVRIGTPVRELIDHCGGYQSGVKKLVVGGPMMGVAQYTDEIPVIRGTSGILVLTAESSPSPPSRPCISCGKCVETCPMGLMPNMIGKLIEHRRFSEAQEYGILDCIECGCCAYVCSAKINLIHLIKYAKQEIRLVGKEKGV